ncbi:MAG: TIM barrel protein [Angelakisella sp.]
MVWFGPAGTADSFSQLGYKKTSQIADYVERMGLNAFEYQCGRGVRVNVDTAATLKAAFAEKKLRMSLHAPYYISLSGVEEETRLGSVRYILESAQAADLLGADRVIVHSGSCSKITREQALELAKDTMRLALRTLDEQGLSHITLCPETMGKMNQLGTLDEVLELCTLDERLVPCVDFGHLNARTLGGMNSLEQFESVLLAMQNKLGTQRMRGFHSHFSKIEYTANGGEKRHLTFADSLYGPEFAPLAELVVKYDCHPVFICESAGTQSEDAAVMQQLYRHAAGIE